MSFLDDLLPRICPLCGSRLRDGERPSEQESSLAAAAVCARCCSNFRRIAAAQRCARCSAPLPQHVAECERCRRTAYCFARHVAVCEYSATAAALVQSYKFRGNRALGRVIAEEMASVAMNAASPETVIVPVPSRRAAVRERGFDAVGLLAATIALRTSRNFVRLLKRSGKSEQKALTFDRRMENVARSISLHPWAGALPASVTLVDDVFTTGATLSECARVLGEAGVEHVECLSFAMDL